MADNSKKEEAQGQFKKMQRAEDGKKAMSEYEANAAATRAKTERLRALRLARDAAEAAAPPKPKASAKKKSVKKETGSAATLTGWLKDQQGGGRRS
jgi:hypothetical protein